VLTVKVFGELSCK